MRAERSCAAAAPSMPSQVLSGALLAVAALSAMAVAPLHAGPPTIPRHFDRAAIEKMVAEIDQGQNAIILKIGYFTRRDIGSFPPRDGLALLKADLAGEKVGSRRWALVESLIGFGSLRTGTDTRQDGLEAYRTLFDRSGDVQAAGASQDLSRAIYEFVSAVPGAYISPHDATTASHQELRSALLAYLDLARHGEPCKYPVPWGRACASGRGSGLGRVIWDTLDDPKYPRSFPFILAAAQILGQTYDPAQAVKVLQTARTMVGKDPAAIKAYHDEWVALLMSMEPSDMAGAIRAQQELIHLTGHGRAGLVPLYSQPGYRNGFDSLLRGLSAADVDEREILDVAVALIVIRMSDMGMAIALRKQGIALLEQYLANGRQKAIEQELRARLVLAETYLPEKRGEALRVLTAEQAAPPMPTATAAMEYGALVRLRDRLRRSGATAASPAP